MVNNTSNSGVFPIGRYSLEGNLETSKNLSLKNEGVDYKKGKQNYLTFTKIDPKVEPKKQGSNNTAFKINFLCKAVKATGLSAELDIQLGDQGSSYVMVTGRNLKRFYRTEVLKIANEQKYMGVIEKSIFMKELNKVSREIAQKILQDNGSVLEGLNAVREKMSLSDQGRYDSLRTISLNQSSSSSSSSGSSSSSTSPAHQVRQTDRSSPSSTSSPAHQVRQTSRSTRPVPVPPLTADQIKFLDQNPYIHGTSTAVFAHMPSSGHELKQLTELLKFKKAPLGGEIFQGGTDALIAKGKTSLGRINHDRYDLRAVLGYTNVGKPSGQDLDKRALFRDFITALDRGFLTQALVGLVRARQQKVNPDEFFKDKNGVNLQKKDEFLQELQNQKLSISNTYAAPLFFTKFVRKNQNSKVDHQIIEEFTKFVNKNSIDLWPLATGNRLNLGQLSQIKDFLSQSGYVIHDKQIIPTVSSSKPSFFTNVNSAQDSIRFGKHLLDNVSALNGHILRDPNSFLQEIDFMQKKLTKVVERTNEHFDLMHEMLTSKGNFELSLSEEDQALVDQPFGLVFFVGSGQEGIVPVRSEYRSKKPLGLGKEITMIATEAANMTKLKDYLKRHGIKDVEVVATEALLARYPK